MKGPMQNLKLILKSLTQMKIRENLHNTAKAALREKLIVINAYISKTKISN